MIFMVEVSYIGIDGVVIGIQMFVNNFVQFLVKKVVCEDDVEF